MRERNRMNRHEYWIECISNAAEEIDLELTDEQLDSLASAAENGHECYGQAFYSPPASDRIADIENAWRAKLSAAQDELRQYQTDAERLMKRALRMHGDDRISIGSDEVLIHYGHTRRVL